MTTDQIYGPDPAPLTKFTVGVSLQDLKITKDVWGDEAFHIMLEDIMFRLGQQICNAVEKETFDTKSYMGEG
jgi:hypothetical protein